MTQEERNKTRKQMFAQMEQKLHESWSSEEDSLFYYHRSEDRIVLSHALFWVMTQSPFLKGKIRKEKLPSVTTFSPRDRCWMLICRIPKITQRCCIIVTSSMSICP